MIYFTPRVKTCASRLRRENLSTWPEGRGIPRSGSSRGMTILAGWSDAAGEGGLFAGSAFGAGAEISKDERVRLVGPGGKLRLKKSGEEETPIREIEGAHFVARATRGDAQSGGFPAGHLLGIGFEIAEVLTLSRIRSAQVMHERTLDRMDGIFSMHLRSFLTKGFTKGGR